MWILIVCGILLVLAVFVVYCCCAVSGWYSEREEREIQETKESNERV